ncbi:serine palmitoyltransferase 2 [Polistes fuscatus]|uniref:serine palmitoyltransferase 2 n=1 Tax=Polistes fuscatus TaxID=30207 RepID=UPI001CA86E82|nr:serine palmitoyltransferase 2 [Polistes fuscatus]
MATTRKTRSYIPAADFDPIVRTTWDENKDDSSDQMKNSLTSYDDSLINGKTNGYTVLRSNGHARCSKNHKNDIEKSSLSKESFEKVALLTTIITHIGFYILMILGVVNQFFFTPKVAQEKNRQGYAPLYNHFEKFYLLYVYRRVRDCWNRPISSVPGAMVMLKDRVTHDYGWTFQFTGSNRYCINLGSYNYLGFAESSGECIEQSIEVLKKLGCASCSTRLEIGNAPIHEELEKLTAKFLGVEDAIVFGMGFATNALNLPCLISKDCLVVSDEKNHASLILGLRLSGATARVFKHNNVKHLEDILKKAIVYGQPKSGKPWKKIIIVVEGIYSMEGSIVHLPEILELKKKYKAYLYVDEAHSIGAIGKHGRGVCDYYGIDPRQIDMLMGTFTKSFGSAGGYIAGTKTLINYLRVHSHAHTYATAMSPPIAQQIISSMRIISGEDGTDAGKNRLKQLARNVRYFRRRLNQIGVIIYGNEDSPIAPMLVFLFSKVWTVVRGFTKYNIATVGVGFPATPLMEARIRFCLSASHTKEHLDYVLLHVEKLANKLGLKYSRKPRDPNPIEYYSDNEME